VNFIQLVNDVRRESSVSGSSVTTTVSQTGEFARLAKWVQRAYEDIQSAYMDWFFLHKESTFTTVIGQRRVTPPTDLNIWDVEKLYDAAGNKMHVMYRNQVDWFLDPLKTGKPQTLIIEPNNQILLWPAPDAAYTYTYEYFRKPFQLLVDTDEPAFPEHFQKVITGRAMMYYANYESAPEIEKQGMEIYLEARRNLIAHQTQDQQQSYGRSSPRDIQIVAQ